MLSNFRYEKDNEGDDSAELESGINYLVQLNVLFFNINLYNFFYFKEEQSESDSQIESNFQWLPLCLIAASYNLDILVFAAVQKFVVLQSGNSNKLEIIASIKIENECYDPLKPV